MSERIALFPGSFDPITVGHTDLIHRGLDLFDRLIIAIGVNTRKKTMFDLEQRRTWLEALYADEPKIEVRDYTGLTVNFCSEVGARYILRGIRSTADFEYEKVIAQLNRSLMPEVDTVLLFSRPEFAHISSTVVKEIILGEGDYSQFVPEVVRL